MKTPPRHSSAWFQQKVAVDLIELTRAIKQAGCQVEAHFWIKRLQSLISHVLETDQEKLLIDILEHLLEHDIDSYIILIDELENACESIEVVDPKTGSTFQSMLILIPLAAWSRYEIPYGPLDSTHCARLKRFLFEHILALDTQLELIPYLLTEEQLPQSYTDTRHLLKQLCDKTFNIGAMPSFQPIADENVRLADTRFLIASVLAPNDKPVFKWQESVPFEGQFEEVQKCWDQKTRDFFQTLLPATQFNLLKPNAFYYNYREIDKLLRPLTIAAGVTWISDIFKLKPSAIQAVVACCTDGGSYEHFRIGFNVNKEVVYGSIWPFFDGHDSEDQHENLSLIKHTLKNLGVEKVHILPGVYQVTMYDDNDIPYYPNTGGEMVQPNVPDHISTTPNKFH